MKKNIVIGTGTVACLTVLIQGISINMLLNFVLAGVIPGTQYVIPYWIMMGIYCALSALIITIYIEQYLRGQRPAKPTLARKAQLPHRRYNHI